MEGLPMILFLLLLIIALAVVAVYATGNAGSHDVTLGPWHWTSLPDWMPVVVAAAVIGGLFLLYMMYSGLVHGVRVGSMRRRVSTRESAINDLRAENQRLRDENARLRSQLRGVAADRPNPNTTAVPAAVGTIPLHRMQPTIGERVRAYFSGRQPARY
jgi:uncharacterized integral membrane protein